MSKQDISTALNQAAEVNKNDPEDCDACNVAGGPCLYHEGWIAGFAAFGQLITKVSADPETAWIGYMREGSAR